MYTHKYKQERAPSSRHTHYYTPIRSTLPTTDPAELEVELTGSYGQKVLKNLRVLSTLFRRPLLLITVCCLIIWFANAVVYYGLVLLTTKLSTTEVSIE